jgi:hypothetical protein
MTTAGVNKVSGNLANAMLSFSGSAPAAAPTSNANSAAKFSGLANQPAKDTFQRAAASPAATGFEAFLSPQNLLNAANAVAFSGNTAPKGDAGKPSFASRFLGSSAQSANTTGLSADQRIQAKQGD